MILQDFHVHTNYCDGTNSPEEMVRAAIDLKMKRIGFSGHAYTWFDEDYCMSPQSTVRYAAEIAELKEKYKGKIEIYCGLELDYFSDKPNIKTDYTIGSVHYVKSGDKFLCVDNSREDFVNAVKEFFDGNYFAFAKEYFKLVSDVVAKTGADIIGHLDLISKFNEGDNLFDSQNPEYVNAAKTAVDRLLAFNKPFEINTGAISRGYRTEAYPQHFIIEHILKSGGRIILSSDSHSADTLCYEFEKYEKLLNDLA